MLQYCDFSAQKISLLRRLRLLQLRLLWAILLQLSWENGHSCHYACLGHCYIRCWNLGSDLHLFDEAMRLLRTAGGKLVHFTFLLYFKSGAVPHRVCWQKKAPAKFKITHRRYESYDILDNLKI